MRNCSVSIPLPLPLPLSTYVRVLWFIGDDALNVGYLVLSSQHLHTDSWIRLCTQLALKSMTADTGSYSFCEASPLFHLIVRESSKVICFKEHCQVKNLPLPAFLGLSGIENKCYYGKIILHKDIKLMNEQKTPCTINVGGLHMHGRNSWINSVCKTHPHLLQVYSLSQAG